MELACKEWKCHFKIDTYVLFLQIFLLYDFKCKSLIKLEFGVFYEFKTEISLRNLKTFFFPTLKM